MTLPRDSRAVVAATGHTRVALLTVLVADDEFAVLEVLSMALEGEGHHVLKAGDGADALRILHARTCDLVVTDEVMPVMSGIQLVEAMRASDRLAHIPVIMTIDVFGVAARRRDLDVVQLAKPVVLPDLFAAVDRHRRRR